MASKTKSKSKSQPKKKRNAYVVGLVVAIVLALLTIFEYYLALLPELYPGTSQPVAGLYLVAFIKAALVVYFFMHVYRLWRPDEHADDHATEGGH